MRLIRKEPGILLRGKGELIDCTPVNESDDFMFLGMTMLGSLVLPCNVLLDTEARKERMHASA